jgi:hypothetical protein
MFIMYARGSVATLRKKRKGEAQGAKLRRMPLCSSPGLTVRAGG